jgi:hypothetical protein
VETAESAYGGCAIIDAIEITAYSSIDYRNFDHETPYSLVLADSVIVYSAGSFICWLPTRQAF